MARNSTWMSASLQRPAQVSMMSAIREKNIYKSVSDTTPCAFGGVNGVMCADFWQVHRVSSTFLACNLRDVPVRYALGALELCLQDGLNSNRKCWQLIELIRRRRWRLVSWTCNIHPADHR